MPDTLSVRFWQKVAKQGPDECWLWTASRTIYDKRGYGHISVDGRLVVAHHVSWFLEYGAWPKDKLLHSCDTPLCVNPKHLFEGNQLDNMADRSAKGRVARVLGEQNGFSKLTEENVRKIRELDLTGMRRLDIAAQFNVTRSAVQHVLRGRNWRHVA